MDRSGYDAPLEPILYPICKILSFLYFYHHGIIDFQLFNVSTGFKITPVGTNIFTRMSGFGCRGRCYQYCPGFPDFPTDPSLIELVNKAMQDGFNQYALCRD